MRSLPPQPKLEFSWAKRWQKKPRGRGGQGGGVKELKGRARSIQRRVVVGQARRASGFLEGPAEEVVKGRTFQRLKEVTVMKHTLMELYPYFSRRRKIIDVKTGGSVTGRLRCTKQGGK